MLAKKKGHTFILVTIYNYYNEKKRNVIEKIQNDYSQH
jgi:hypothetical protein